MIKEVLVIGGTHGNEKVGVYIAKYLKQNPIKNLSFTLRSVLANEEAIIQDKRYIDYDLNRSFNEPSLDNQYELSRSRVLGKEVKDPATTFVIDLHTTTSNMGITYILSKTDQLSKEMAFRMQRGQAGEFVLESKLLDKQAHFVNSIADHGLMIEVGPVAQNYYCTKNIEKTWQTLNRLLQLIDERNKDSLLPMRGNLNYFKEVSYVDFPRDEQGEILYLIHPNLISRDFQMIKPDDPIFYRLDGSILSCTEAENLYPVFINEAAYYEKQMAMMLCERRNYKLT